MNRTTLAIKARLLPMGALALLAGLFQALAPVPAHAAFDLTPYQDTYYVQQPWNLPLASRFSVTTGGATPIYNAWIEHGDQPLRQGSTTGSRTEMHWWTIWGGNEHMWGAYVWIDPGTDNSCIMQIKSGDGGNEAIYVVAKGGNLYNSVGPQIAANMYGRWFWMVTDYNPANQQAHIWINGSLA